ncbi:putative Longin-like domain superfamily protein [Helianthus anomalus]
MIRAVIVINDQGKPRLVKFYDYQVSRWRNNRKSFGTYTEMWS